LALIFLSDLIKEIKNEIYSFTDADLYLERATEEDQQTIIIKEYEEKGRLLVISFSPFAQGSDFWAEDLPTDPSVAYLRPLLPSFMLRGSRHQVKFEEYIKRSTQTLFSSNNEKTNKSNVIYLMNVCKKFLISNPESVDNIVSA